MSVSLKSPVTSTNVNAKFMSRTVDTSTTGKINQTNTTNATDENTGAFHTEGGMSVLLDLFVGGQINAGTFVNIVKTYTSQSVAASGTISVDPNQSIQMRRVIGDTVPVDASLTPLGDLTAAKDGLIVLLIGQSDANTVKISFNDSANGCYINGDAVLKRGSVLALIWDSINQRLFELCRNF